MTSSFDVFAAFSETFRQLLSHVMKTDGATDIYIARIAHFANISIFFILTYATAYSPNHGYLNK